MGKPGRERSLPANEAKASAKNLRISPQKLNLVAGMIRGKKVDQALADLEFSRKRIAGDVRKCLASAVANAEENHGLDIDSLVVSQAWVGKNLVMKRFTARGRGRSAPILKPFSEITVVVRQVEEAAAGKARPKKSEKKAGSGKPAEAKPEAAAKPASAKPAAAKRGKAKAAPAKKETA
jgi:ribosomal protein L22, bacterial type